MAGDRTPGPKRGADGYVSQTTSRHPTRIRGRRGKNTVILVEEEDEKPPEVEDVTEADRERIEQAKEVAAEAALEAPESVEVRIFRSHPSLGGGKMNYVDTIGTEVFSLEYVAENYGGGKYKAEFFGIRKLGNRAGKGLIRTEAFEIDPAISPRNPKNLGLGGAGAPSKAGGEDSMKALVDGGIVALLQAQVSMIERLNKPSVDWGTVLTAVGAIMTPIITSLMSRKDPVELAKEIVATTQPTAHKDGLKEMRELLGLLGELKSAAGLESPEDMPPWLRVVDKFAPKLLDAARVQDQMAMTQQQQQPTQPQQPEDMTNPTQLVQAIAPQLAAWASQGRSTAWACEALLYDIPEGLHPMLAQRLQQPSIIPEIVTNVPTLAPFQGWLESLREELLAAILGGDEDDSDDPNHSSDDAPPAGTSSDGGITRRA